MVTSDPPPEDASPCQGPGQGLLFQAPPGALRSQPSQCREICEIYPPRAFGSPTPVTVESPMDGTDVPVLVAGKPTGETMGIKSVDSHHTFTVLKVNGKQYGTSKAELSADLKTLTVENEFTAAAQGHQPGKSTEIWVRK